VRLRFPHVAAEPATPATLTTGVVEPFS